jgi:hypothetical protein
VFTTRSGGEADRDGGPDIRGAFQFQIAAVELHQGTAQRKAKAGALVRAGIDIGYLPEGFQNDRDILGGDANA